MSKKHILIGIVAIGPLSLYFLFNPGDFEGYYPECVFHKYTGYHCPGCGTQRALHDLLHLRIGSAFSHNPLLITALVTGILLFFFKRELFNKIIYHPKTPIIVFIVIVVFWVLRNLSFPPFTYLAP